MNSLNIKYFITLIFMCFLFSEKNSSDIQNDINNRNEELTKIMDDIQKVEELIHTKINEEDENQAIINQINNKINLTEKLIRSLNEEEIYLAGLIIKTENRITLKEKELIKLKNQLKNRVQYLYKNGKENMISELLNSNNWDRKIYRIKYLNILNKYEKDIKDRINKNIYNLKNEQKNLKKEKERKQYLLSQKNAEFKNLEKDRKLKKEYSKKLKNEKKNLEYQLEDKKNMMAEIESLIKELISNKNEIQKRENELAKIRAQKNQSTSGNFAKMKGRLEWPTKGKIINKFGIQTNNKLNTLYENIGIDIETKANESVYAVLDGVITSITYIMNYGNVIIIDHGGGYYTVYSNVENIQISENAYVNTQSEIAEVGINQSGQNILHFEVWSNQKKIDPEIWLK